MYVLLESEILILVTWHTQGLLSVPDRNMSGGLTPQQFEQFEKDGILVIQDFLTKEEVSSVRDAIHDIIENMDPKTDRGVFSTTGCQQVRSGIFSVSFREIF